MCDKYEEEIPPAHFLRGAAPALSRRLIVAVPLLPSLHAGGVTGILEAAAMGKPAIVSDIEAIAEFVVPARPP